MSILSLVIASFIAAFLAAINPWSIFFARSGYESIFSAFFYLLAIYVIFSFKAWKILWATPLFLAGLLSYFSAKTIMLPLALFTLAGARFTNPKGSVKPALLVSFLLLIFLTIYLPLLSELGFIRWKGFGGWLYINSNNPIYSINPYLFLWFE